MIQGAVVRCRDHRVGVGSGKDVLWARSSRESTTRWLGSLEEIKVLDKYWGIHAACVICLGNCR